MPPRTKSKNIGAKGGCATRRTQCGTGITKKLVAVGEKPVHREVLYALVCEKNDDRVVRGIVNGGVAEKEKMRERIHSVMAHRERRSACVW